MKKKSADYGNRYMDLKSFRNQLQVWFSITLSIPFTIPIPISLSMMLLHLLRLVITLETRTVTAVIFAPKEETGIQRGGRECSQQ